MFVRWGLRLYMFRFMLWLQKQYVLCLRVTKTIRLQKHIERGYKNKKRVPPPKGYKNRWGLGGLVEWVTKTLILLILSKRAKEVQMPLGVCLVAYPYLCPLVSCLYFLESSSLLRCSLIQRQSIRAYGKAHPVPFSWFSHPYLSDRVSVYKRVEYVAGYKNIYATRLWLQKQNCTGYKNGYKNVQRLREIQSYKNIQR